MIIIAMASPDRNTLESLRTVNRELPKPVVFSAEHSDYETTQAAIQAGVSAYVVDGLSEHRLKSILEVAIARFREFLAVQGKYATAGFFWHHASFMEHDQISSLLLHRSCCDAKT